MPHTPSEEADDYRQEFVSSLGEDILVPASRTGSPVGLALQDSRIGEFCQSGGDGCSRESSPGGEVIEARDPVSGFT